MSLTHVDGTDVPTGSNLKYSQFSPGSVATCGTGSGTGTYITKSFAYTLSAGTKYALVLGGTNSGNTQYTWTEMDSSEPPTPTKYFVAYRQKTPNGWNANTSGTRNAVWLEFTCGA